MQGLFRLLDDNLLASVAWSISLCHARYSSPRSLANSPRNLAKQVYKELGILPVQRDLKFSAVLGTTSGCRSRMYFRIGCELPSWLKTCNGIVLVIREANLTGEKGEDDAACGFAADGNIEEDNGVYHF